MKYFSNQLAATLSIIFAAMTISYLYGMEPKKKIILKIFPESVRYQLEGKEINGQKLAVLQISGVDELTLFDKLPNSNPSLINYSSIPETFSNCLKNHSAWHYPIHLHRMLKTHEVIEQFTILRYEKDTSDPVEINLPETVKKRLLQYLCTDLYDATKDNSFFVHTVLFDTNEIPLTQEIDNEQQFNAGDGVLISSIKTNSEGSPSFLNCYFAIALGNGLYISQIEGGLLVVSTLDFLMQINPGMNTRLIKIIAQEKEIFLCYFSTNNLS